MNNLTKYMKANKMALNPDKTTVMLIAKDNLSKHKFSVKICGGNIKHHRKVTILGNLLNDKLTCDDHIMANLLPALANRLQTLKLVAGYLDQKFKQIYAN